ncbi:MAG: Ig-like domain-containing protein [Verrucomicrobia bacterium]|nr:Ig-like domain-containing protein [Verrucomicrobiota bacterium]
MLRYVMASPEKVTVARADVSHWKAGEWHHVVVGWFTNHVGIPVGLPLWIDKVAVDGPIASGNAFLDPAAMDDARLWIGDETSQAAMDELVMRAKERPSVDLVYRDYFRTGPFTAIEIDAEPHAVPADRRVVNGYSKPFGLRGKLNGRWERMIEYVGGAYWNWTHYDAKSFTTWSTSDKTIATVDEEGRVSGHKVGRCTLTAEFHGLKASYDVSVIPMEQPDLVLYVVELLPRYLEMAVKNHHAPGETVKSVARIANFGFMPAPSGVAVTFELIPDANGNYRLDADERAIPTKRATTRVALEPLEETAVEFEWTWPDTPVWVRVTVDPGNGVDEISEANNRLVELNTARSMIWAYNDTEPANVYNRKRMNLTGSFCYYDWLRAQSDRLRLILRESVYPTTSPVGVLDDTRIGEVMCFDTPCPEGRLYDQHSKYHEGGYPICLDSDEDLDWIMAGTVHELGHTMLALPDLYGHPVHARGVLVTDANGKLYAGGPLVPELNRSRTTIVSPAEGVECGASYGYLMNNCRMVMHPAFAGQVQYFRGCRGDKFWGVHGLLIPTSRNELLVLDANDEPLAGAAVYAYQAKQAHIQDGAAKFFADRAKYVGHTNEEGRYVFPGETDRDWDSPDTDEVEGSVELWNPFAMPDGPIIATPTCFDADGMMLLRIASGDQTEFHWLTLTMMNEAFLSGHKNWGIYTIRTSLTPFDGETPIIRHPVPDAVREKNLRPVAKVDIQPSEPDGELELTAKMGESVRIDGSASFDPEGQPLAYRWQAPDEFDREERFGSKPVFDCRAPLEEEGDFEIAFYVIDGIRESEPIWITLHVVGDGAKASEAEDAE